MYNAETGIKLRIIDNVDVKVIILILLEYVIVNLLVNWVFIIQLTELLQQLCHSYYYLTLCLLYTQYVL